MLDENNKNLFLEFDQWLTITTANLLSPIEFDPVNEPAGSEEQKEHDFPRIKPVSVILRQGLSFECNI